MNNSRIKDIYDTGRDHYNYLVLKDVKEQALPGQNVWLNLRGVNYGCDIFINGTRLNKKTHHGIFLRQSYNISGHVNKNGSNRLALIVYPSDPVGNSNGGQGGDGTIAKSGAHQYVAGRDRIQPIPDRNTGI
jgi:mannosylglycoprotein endo-beta-mannosidase